MEQYYGYIIFLARENTTNGLEKAYKIGKSDRRPRVNTVFSAFLFAQVESYFCRQLLDRGFAFVTQYDHLVFDQYARIGEHTHSVSSSRVKERKTSAKS